MGTPPGSFRKVRGETEVDELRANLDFLAIAVIVAVLGLAQAPDLSPRTMRTRMEHPSLHLRILKLHPNVHTIPYMR